MAELFDIIDPIAIAEVREASLVLWRLNWRMSYWLFTTRIPERVPC